MQENVLHVFLLQNARRNKMDPHNLKIVPIITNITPNINNGVQKALEEKEINQYAYEKYLERKYGNTSGIY